MGNYLKTAFRSFWKNKTYSFLNILGLSVGITCAALIFLWVEDEFSFNSHNEKKDQLYRIYTNQEYDGRLATSYVTPGLLGPVMKDEVPGIRNTCRFSWDHYTLFGLGEKTLYERGYYVDPSVFDMFTVHFIQGKKENAFPQLHSIVISEKMAGKFFRNDENIIGKTLRMDNDQEYLIGGVIRDIPENSTFRFDWLAPFQVYLDRSPWFTEWVNNGVLTFAELEQQADPDQVNSKISGFIQSKDSNAKAKPFLFAMNDWRLYGKFEAGRQVGGRIQYVRMFSVIAWIILLIACINFMNLATARSEKRAREVGVRKVLGAAKRTLIARFITEAMLTSFLSVLLAVCILYVTLPAFNLLVGKHLSLGLETPLHLLYLVLIGLVCGLVAGSYPALYLSSFNPVRVFKGMNIKGSTPAQIRKGLVVLQFTISIVLIISTIIIYQQIQHIKNRELGFNKSNLVQTALRGDMQKNYVPLKQELLSTGFVENTTMSNLNMLYMGSNSSWFRWEGKDPTRQVLITQDFVSPEYLSTAGIQIKAGRDFYQNGKPDSLSVIINETLAAIIGGDPVGKIFTRATAENKGIDYTIVGITKDFVFDDMYGKPDPLVFFTYPEYYGYMYIRLRPDVDNSEAMSAIASIVKKNNPGYPFDYIFVDDEFNNQFKTEMLIGKLSRVFAFLAILISCLGLFGLAAYTAERRRKEIGIRKVLGASVTGITGLLSKDFLQLVGISAMIAFPLAWWFMHDWLQDYSYRISISWWVFILAACIAVLIALLTISFQSIRAAISNPVKSLRTE
jgi:putative ABC transport system permease protein